MLKYKIRIPTTSGSTGSHINIPISMENQMVDQGEIIERKFVDVEVEKSINPIIDYEKVKFKPYFGTSPIDDISYNLTFNGGLVKYGEIGFNDTDLALRKNSFSQSFLRLNFYDTDILSRQRLISSLALFSTIYEDETDVNSKTISAANKYTNFKVINERVKTADPSEGFNVFHFKDEVGINSPKELFMRAEFNNAKNGKTTNFMTSSNVVGIDDLVNQLHTKYVLKRSTDYGYYYEIDSAYSTNVSGSVSRVVRLYEIDSL
jgi:hypothetical protein